MKRALDITQVRPLAEHEAYINIENVVATATLNQNIDLNSIVRIFPGVEYRPEQFPGLVYRLRKPKTTTLIFSSGKMVCTGAKSERQARKAVTKVVDELKRNGTVILRKPEIQIQNIVASAGLGGHIDLEKSTYSTSDTGQKNPNPNPAARRSTSTSCTDLENTREMVANMLKSMAPLNNQARLTLSAKYPASIGVTV